MGSLNFSPPSPSFESDCEIPRLVADSFQSSIDQGYIHLYAASRDHPFRVTDDPPRFPQFGHVVPRLRDKPAVPPSTPDLSKRREKDVLQGPDYGKGEKILQLEQGGITYSLVHNLHALFPEHMMAIPYFGDKGAFRPQTSDLLPQDLYLAARVVNAYAHAGRETTMFFNGGPLAGASQPHLHMQFCPFQYGSPPGPEALARSLSSPSSSEAPPPPVNDRDETSTMPLHPDPANANANADQFTPAPRLPLPWTQFYLPLPRATKHGGPPTSEEELYGLYTRLLRTSKDYIASIESSKSGGGGGAGRPDDDDDNRARVPPPGPKRDSYNLFLTSQHMHLIPRTDRLVALEREDDDDHHHHGKEEDDDDDDLLRISLNGLVYLGYWHVPSEEDWHLLVRKAGLGRVLQRAAYVNEQYHHRHQTPA